MRAAKFQVCAKITRRSVIWITLPLPVMVHTVVRFWHSDSISAGNGKQETRARL
jgi:hypothetical protein